MAEPEFKLRVSELCHDVPVVAIVVCYPYPVCPRSEHTFEGLISDWQLSPLLSHLVKVMLKFSSATNEQSTQENKGPAICSNLGVASCAIQVSELSRNLLRSLVVTVLWFHSQVDPVLLLSLLCRTTDRSTSRVLPTHHLHLGSAQMICPAIFLHTEFRKN